MAASKRQIASNRRNAQKSTGPVTPEGKLVASRNAIKHGLHACDAILKSAHLTEDREQYEVLVDSLVEELKPVGILQEHLVLKIINAMWRYRRVINAETSRINRQLEDAADDIERGNFFGFQGDADEIDDETVAQHNANLVGSKSVPGESFRKSLMFYEMRLDRQLTRAIRLLQRLQEKMDSGSKPGMTETEKMDSGAGHPSTPLGVKSDEGDPSTALRVTSMNRPYGLRGWPGPQES
ncbi:MAG: hypothetical protein OEV49_03260 [candidate division Zixibacteria bacterium]|nr:hypothetical protein [candidate division Zixibacteria bacterium]MDH3937079.1 hypothetical protein [candidate division Zixibacteria bacterium]MDH4033619.1 hypothetical protein [candidate division Zixibacteria bacterium]